MVSHPPPSFSPTCSLLTPPSVASFPLPVPTSFPGSTAKTSLPCPDSLTVPPGQVPSQLWASLSPSVQQEGGQAPGSSVIHHCHHHPSMEEVLIEKKGREGESSHLQSTNCIPGPASSGADSSPLHAKKLRLRGSGTHLKIHNQEVTLELSTTCPLPWLAPTYCA